VALAQGAYGAGLLNERERAEIEHTIGDLTREQSLSRADLAAGMKRIERVVDWAQQNATVAFAEVWAPWTFLLPAVSGIGDDVLRSSPLLVFADVATRLDDFARGGTTRHDVFGSAVDTGMRALNPGLAMGRLRVGPPRTAMPATRSSPCRRRPPTSSRRPASSRRARATCCRTSSSWRGRSASRTSSSRPASTGVSRRTMASRSSCSPHPAAAS
jgi:hypothetical protein